MEKKSPVAVATALSLLPSEKKLYNAEGSDLRVKCQRRGRFVEVSVNGGIVLWKVQTMQLPFFYFYFFFYNNFLHMARQH